MLSQAYQQAILVHEVHRDPMQAQLLPLLDQLAISLEQSQLRRWFSRAKPVKGLYIYGPVGRGKTFLMDLFFKTVQTKKQRLHFYEFMNQVHAELKWLQGEREPLQQVAQKFAREISLLCLDEFFVEDIADAMILASLLSYLFRAGVCVVVTSNLAPEDLYQDGLQRDRFLPAIALLRTYMDVFNLNHPHDYRLEKKWLEERYHVDMRDSEAYLQAHFKHYKQAEECLPTHFQLNTRDIEAVLRSKTVGWFSFTELCMKPHGARDYLALTQQFKVILLENIPVLTIAEEDAARRFIALVDACYDKKILLIITAAAPLATIYQGTRVAAAFERTRSRLIEMSSW